jgi:hypothetical protein
MLPESSHVCDLKMIKSVSCDSRRQIASEGEVHAGYGVEIGFVLAAKGLSLHKCSNRSSSFDG